MIMTAEAAEATVMSQRGVFGMETSNCAWLIYRVMVQYMWHRLTVRTLTFTSVYCFFLLFVAWHQMFSTPAVGLRRQDSWERCTPANRWGKGCVAFLIFFKHIYALALQDEWDILYFLSAAQMFCGRSFSLGNWDASCEGCTWLKAINWLLHFYRK